MELNPTPPSDPLEEIEKLREELKQSNLDLEAQVLRQDHRPWPVIKNYLHRNELFEKDDPRYSSVKRAFWMMVLFQRGGQVATVGLLAIIGIIISLKANWLFEEQNKKIDRQTELFAEQNKALIKQFEQSERFERRREIQAELWQLKQELSQFKVQKDEFRRTKETTIPSGLRARIEAFCNNAQWWSLERDPDQLSNERGSLFLLLAQMSVDTSLFNFDFANLVYADLSLVELKSARLSKANLTRSRFFGSEIDSGFLRGANVSRANFNRAALNHTYFDEANLENSSFRGSNISGGSFEQSNLYSADFRRATLVRVRMKKADLYKANLRKAILESVDLSGANLSKIKNWDEIVSIGNSNILGIQNAPEGFRKWALENGAVEMEPDEYQEYLESL